MKFKTVREAFNWLQQCKGGVDDRNCWLAVIDHQRRQGDIEIARHPFEAALTAAESLCSDWANSGNPPGQPERTNLQRFTDSAAADPLLAAANSYCTWLEQHREMVPAFHY